jgi:hypothetical protein
MDWREFHVNCENCVEFIDNEHATKLCRECQCYYCKQNREECISVMLCKRDNTEMK